MPRGASGAFRHGLYADTAGQGSALRNKWRELGGENTNTLSQRVSFKRVPLRRFSPPRVTDIVSRYIWQALFTINLFLSQQSDRMGELFLFHFLSVLSVGDALAVGAASSHAFPYEHRVVISADED